MTDEAKRIWDVIIAITGSAITIASVFIGIYQFNKQQNDNDVMEFKRQMYKIRADNYSKICGTAGILASIYTSDTAYMRATGEFERYFWSSINVPPDRSVTMALQEFRETLQHTDTASRKTQEGHNSLAYDAANLQDSCYSALIRNWQTIEK